MEGIDYLIIGHVTLDLPPEGSAGGSAVPGGTVTYAGRTAQALGCRTASLTSADDSFDFAANLPGIEVHSLPAAQTTTFTNTYTPSGRVQHVHGLAQPLTAADLPAGWSSPRIVHLGPLVREVDPAFANLFPGSVVGITPQGWMRDWDADGRVSARRWPEAAAVLPLANVVVLSEEDLLYPAMLDEYRALCPLLVLTASAKGCTVFAGDEVRRIDAPTVPEVEPTGAGDIFAAAFLTYYDRLGGDHWEAARRANHLAAASVTVAGLDAKLDAMRAATSAS